METVNQEQTAKEQERTFTQAELDAIVSERLRRDREKYADYETYKAKAEKYDAAEEASKSELQKATELAEQYKAQLDTLQKEISARNAREKVSIETGIPSSLLTGTTEEECKKQAETLAAWSGKQNKYPNVKDAGETAKVTGGKTRDQFADWFQNFK